MIGRLVQQEDLNFLLTNRIPRRFATLFLGWWSRIESPLVVGTSLAVWKQFAPELDFSEARTTEFRSLRDCFIRELRPGARPIASAPDTIVSPCDAIVGACGRIEAGTLIQAKDLDYALADLLGDEALARRHQGGRYVTLRLKSTMYHRFHAPTRCRVSEVIHIAGDTWNVNPIALARVERLFCRNERAVIPLRLEPLLGPHLEPRVDPRRGADGHDRRDRQEDSGAALTLVAIAAIGVATLRLHCLDSALGLRYAGPTRIACDARYEKGQELGWFEQGSTIVVLASPDLVLADRIREGRLVKVGEPLLIDMNARSREGLDRAGGTVRHPIAAASP